MEANLCLCSRFEWKRICVCVVVVNGSESVFCSSFEWKRIFVCVVVVNGSESVFV
jgi:hypothetical protein